MMLGLPAAVSEQYDLSKVTKLMISSAPARQDTKREVMGMFRNSGLYELYGATMLHPHEQYTKLGSVGRVRRIGADQAVGRGRQRSP
jgi:fatty-acyl-CoA synthase